MSRSKCRRIAKTKFKLEGVLGEYVRGVTKNWLLVAPYANPAMLEMFRDRDSSPYRQLTGFGGEFAGKYLTGAVQMLRLSGDAELKGLLKDFVARLISAQAEDGYLGPWQKSCRLDNYDSKGMLTWDTWGHYHIMLGLILWHEETGDKKALQCACRIADLICRKYLGKKKRIVDTPFGKGSHTEMNLAPVHALAILYKMTKNKQYLEMALQLVDELAAMGKDGPLVGDYFRQALAGKEYFEMPKPRWEALHIIMAFAELYWATNDARYRCAFERLWWSMVKTDRRNNGGFTAAERARGNPYSLRQIESCCTIAWIALSVEMLKLSGTSVVADEMELSILNSVVGMHARSGSWVTYHTGMNGVRRSFINSAYPHHGREGCPELNCCSANSPRGFGMISDWALMRDADGVLLNWYGPSVISARIRPGLSLTLRQETTYPVSGRVLIHVTPTKSARFALKLRIPYWSAKTRVRVNGETVSGIEAGHYLCLERKWKEGDTIELGLDMSLHYWVGERECKGFTSIFRGPILLTFDHRYNLDLAPRGQGQVRDFSFPFDESEPRFDYMLKPPVLDARQLQVRLVKWDDWLAPAVLLRAKAANGKTVHLCDFGSAGDVGTPYMSWLRVRNAPRRTAFSPENPLRSAHR